MVGNVILSGACEPHRTPCAARRAIRINDGKVEASHERTPGNAGSTEEVANVLTSHLDLIPGWVRANVTNRIGVANYGERPVASINFIARAVQSPGHAVGLPGNQVEGSGR